MVMSRSSPEKSPEQRRLDVAGRRRGGRDLLEVHDHRIGGQRRDEGLGVRTTGIGRRRLVGRRHLAGRRDGRHLARPARA